MAFWFVNKFEEEKKTMCFNEADAKEKLDAFLEICRGRNYQIEKHEPVDDDYPSFLVHDQSGALVGDFTDWED
jgi:hypothetical protein